MAWSGQNLTLSEIYPELIEKCFSNNQTKSVEWIYMNEENLTLEVFSDFVWPWCYLVTGRVKRLEKKFKLSIKWVQFPLHPETPNEGLSLEELFAGRDLDIPAIQAHHKELMRLEGLPYGNRTHTFNSRLAQEL